MHVTKGGWVGQTFAFAASNDSRGRKSRRRRSKEERKEMVESFIKKYQKSSNGNFPSLNLTHKEVGGSFYTVREIVREIIQENRVLGPAKSFPEEQNNSEFLKQYPLGSVSIEPETDFLVSDKTHAVIDIRPDHHWITTGKHFSTSNSTLGPESFSSGNDAVNGHNQAVQKGSEEQSIKHRVPIPHDTGLKEVSKASKQLSQPKSREFDNEQTLTSSIVPQNYEHDGPKFPQFSGKVSEPATGRLSDEHIVNADRVLERTKDFEERLGMESAVMESQDRKNNGTEELKASETVISPVTADVVVEKFPLRPLSSNHEAGGGSNKSSDGTGTLGYEEVQYDRTSVESFSGLINEKVEDKFPTPILERNSEFSNEKSLKPKGPSLESSNRCGTDEATALDVEGIPDVESKHSLPDGTLAGDSPEQLISTETTAVGEKPNMQDDDCWKENSPVLDRISQDTQEGTSKKTSAPETNVLWALFIAFLLALVKFWTK